MPTLNPSKLCLLYYFDETGHEQFADPHYPIFGIAGCAVLTEGCFRLLDQPWREMKRQNFGSPDTPLHASTTLRTATPEQRAAIEGFFRSGLFSRFAAVIRFDSPIPQIYPPCQIVAGAIYKRIEQVATPYPLDSMALIFEASQRGDELVQRYFGPLRAERDATNAMTVHRAFMRKDVGEPGLEIADIIANTAGRHVRHAMKTGTHEPNSMFDAIFRSVPAPLVSYMEITSAEVKSNATEA